MILVLLIFIVIISGVLVRMAAFALELTGMTWEDSKFQALSAFTNAGFTTRESEQIMKHPMRRKIVTTLILLGNAGLVTAIGTFAGTFMRDDLRTGVLNVALLVGAVAGLFLLTQWQAPMNYTRKVMQRWMSDHFDFQGPKAEQLLRLGLDFQLTRIEITQGSPVAYKALRDLDLKSWRVQVLAIERAGNFNPVPSGLNRLLPGDAIIVYGSTSGVRKVFRPRRSVHLTVAGMAAVSPSAA